MPKTKNIIEAIVSFPSIVLDQIVRGAKMTYLQERELWEMGEIDEEESEE